MSDQPEDNKVLRLDYEKTNDYIELLADIRFKLLAIVPTITGASIALLTINKNNAESAFVLGIFGLFADLGIISYELRNSQLYDAAISRAKRLERLLKMPRCTHFGYTPRITDGGLFCERPLRPKLFGLIPIWHDRGLALIYGATISGWTYIIIYAYFRLKELQNVYILSRSFSIFEFAITVAFIVGAIIFVEFHRIEKSSKKLGLVACDDETERESPQFEGEE